MSAVCCLCKPERWHDWRWQFRHRLRTIEQLGQVIKLTPEEEADLSQPNFVVGITPYFASLMDPEDPTCPIRRQAIPLAAMGASGPGTAADPLNEEGLSPVSRIIHRYPDGLCS